MTKPNCYECRWWRDALGSAHSRCEHPEAAVINKDPMLDALAILAGARGMGLGSLLGTPSARALKVEANPHGVRHGWFNWPLDFDPTWLVACEGFEGKEVLDTGK